MSTISHKDKLLALAHLKSGKSPRQVSEILDDVSYSTALRLRKDLEQAELEGTIADLFSLDDTAIETLMDAVKEDLASPVRVLTGDVETLNTSVANVTANIAAGKLLEENLANAASTLAKQIEARALTTLSTDGLLLLAEALAKLQSSYFAKGTNVQVNNYGDKFEEYLSD